MKPEVREAVRARFFPNLEKEAADRKKAVRSLLFKEADEDQAWGEEEISKEASLPEELALPIALCLLRKQAEEDMKVTPAAKQQAKTVKTKLPKATGTSVNAKGAVSGYTKAQGLPTTFTGQTSAWRNVFGAQDIARWLRNFKKNIGATERKLPNY